MGGSEQGEGGMGKAECEMGKAEWGEAAGWLGDFQHDLGGRRATGTVTPRGDLGLCRDRGRAGMLERGYEGVFGLRWAGSTRIVRPT